MKTYTFIDRGADRGLHRFCVVAPLADMLQPPDPVCTDRGTFPLLRVGTPYLAPKLGLVANHYLAVYARAIGAPARLTEEVLAYRAQRQERAQKARKAQQAAMTPAEREALKKKQRKGLRKWRASLTKEERAALKKRRIDGLKAWHAAGRPRRGTKLSE